MLVVADGEDVQVQLTEACWQSDSRHTVRYIYLENRVTLGTKRNFCCDRARGEFIVHWDDDDENHPDRIAEQLARLKSSPAIQVTGYHRLLFRDLYDDAFYMWESPSKTPCGSSLMYRKSWWQGHRFDPINIQEDVCFIAEARGHVDSTDGEHSLVASIHPKNTSHRNLELDMYRKLA